MPKALDQLVMRMISKDPGDRPSLEEVSEVLATEDFNESVEINLPSRIVLTVSARQGVLRVLDPEGHLHATLGDIGVGPGSFSAAPLSVSVDSEGNFFAAIFEYRVGQDDHRMIHKLGPDGSPIISFGSYGMKTGEFLYPVSVAVAPDDTVYVLDSETHLVQRFNNDGTFISSFGGRGTGQGNFNDPRLISVNRSGSVYVLDYGNRQVQRFNPEGRYETRWAFRMGADQDGMRLLDGVTVDSSGNLFISDATAGKVRMVTPSGTVGQSFALEPPPGRGHRYSSRSRSRRERKPLCGPPWRSPDSEIQPQRRSTRDPRDLRAGGADGYRRQAAGRGGDRLNVFSRSAGRC